MSGSIFWGKWLSKTTQVAASADLSTGMWSIHSRVLKNGLQVRRSLSSPGLLGAVGGSQGRRAPRVLGTHMHHWLPSCVKFRERKTQPCLSPNCKGFARNPLLYVNNLFHMSWWLFKQAKYHILSVQMAVEDIALSKLIKNGFSKVYFNKVRCWGTQEADWKAGASRTSSLSMSCRTSLHPPACPGSGAQGCNGTLSIFQKMQ